MSLTKRLALLRDPTIIDELRASHSPQCTKGKVPAKLLVGLCPNGDYAIWDSPQTSGFLCTTKWSAVLHGLLQLESSSPGAVRQLITSERNTRYDALPEPDQETYRPIEIPNASSNPSDVSMGDALDLLDDFEL